MKDMPFMAAVATGARSENTVMFGTGQFVFTKTFLVVPSIGSFTWRLGLNFLQDAAVGKTIFGNQFNFPQNVYLTTSFTGNTIELFTGEDSPLQFESMGSFDGGSHTVFRPGSDAYGARSVIVRDNSAPIDGKKFYLLSHDGTKTYFSNFTGNPELSTYHQKSVVDRHGNIQVYDWSSIFGTAVRLNTVTDPFGRVADYHYNGSDPTLVSSITDPLGREIYFQYDNNDNLTAIILPAINETAGQKYPLGTAYVFDYDNEDRISHVFYPDQTNTWLYKDPDIPKVNTHKVYEKSEARNVVDYYATKFEGKSRVRYETVGSGWYSFDYEDPSSAGDWHTDVTDRNRARTRYEFTPFNSKLASKITVFNNNKSKNSLQSGPYSTFIEYDKTKQPRVTQFPNGKKIVRFINNGRVFNLSLSDDEIDWRQMGAIQESTIHSAGDSNDILRTIYVYDPLYNQIIATVDPRAYSLRQYENKLFTPQLGPAARRATSFAVSYATGYYYDFQDQTYAQIKASPQIRSGLFGYLSDENYSTALESLFESTRWKWLHNSADLNPDDYLPRPTSAQAKITPVTQEGSLSGTNRVSYNGNLIQVRYPDATNRTGQNLPRTASQQRIESFTYNAAGQMTTATDAEGNVTAIRRYPRNNPANQSSIRSSTKEALEELYEPTQREKRYGFVAAVYADVNPRSVPGLVGGSDADMPGFSLITQRGGGSQPGTSYQNITTRYRQLDGLGNPTRVIDPRGQETKIDRTELGEPYRITGPKQDNHESGMIEFYYSPNRNLIRRDIQDIVVKTDGEHFEIAGNSNDDLSLETKTGPGGNKRSNWFVDEYTYDILDNLTRQDTEATDSDQRHTTTLTTRYRYDGNENLILVVSPEGNTIELDYDERNLLIAERVGNRWTGGDGGYSPRLIEQLFDEDRKPIAALTVYTYDANGNLTLVLGPRLGSTSRGFESDGVMKINQAFGQTVLNSINEEDRTLEVPTASIPYLMRYDGFDRLTVELSQPGYVTTYQYDPINNMIRSKHFEGYDFNSIDNSDLAFGAIPGSNQVVQLADTINRFDQQGRLYEQQESVFVPLNQRQRLGSAAQEIGTLQPLNWQDNHERPVLGTDQVGALIPRLADLKEGGVSRTLSASTFDRAGRVYKAWADNGSCTEILYDGVSRVVREKDALGNAAVYFYDAASNVVGTRMVEVHPAKPRVFETFASQTWYDLVNRPVMTAAQGPKAGRLTDDRNALPDDAITMKFGYDSRGNLTHAIDPRGNTAQTQYDAASRPLRVLQQLRKDGLGTGAVQSTILTQTAYDLNSRVTQLTDANGNATAYGYDSLDRTTDMTYADGSKESYRYNTASDLIGHTDPNGTGFDYEIDDLGRVTRVMLAQSSGNPHILTPTKNVDGFTVNNAGIELQRFEYDGLSRLTYTRDSTVEPGLTSETGQTTDFIYDGARTCEEREPGLYDNGSRTNSDAALLRQYVWGQYIDELIQQREYRPSSAEDFEDLYPIGDLHYRTAALAASDGDIIETYDYDAYGNTLIFPCKGPDGCTTWKTTDNQTVPDPLCNYLYQGRYYDPETGLYDFRARAYHPELGIFLQRDPLGYVDGMNLYQFEGGMPTEALDPEGEAIFTLTGLAIIAAVTLIGGGGVAAAHYGAYEAEQGLLTGDMARYERGQKWVAGGTIAVGIAAGIGLAPVLAPIGAAAASKVGLTAGTISYGFTAAVTTGAIEGAIMGGLQGAAISYSRGGSSSDIVRSAVIHTAVGGAAGALFGGGLVAAGRLIRSATSYLRRAKANRYGDAGRIYTETNNLNTIARDGRVWGSTEGSVYGMKVPNAPRALTMANSKNWDAGTIIFEGQAATLFRPHEVHGFFSGLKRLLGQQKAGFGDIAFDKSTATLIGNILIVRNAKVVAHATSNQSASQAASRLWARRAFDYATIGVPAGSAGLIAYDRRK
ncbi:MAG: RHS repeat-associated core domain-containing protein [Planctomycetota bacterium]